MACSVNKNKIIEWTLKPEHVEEMYQYLYDKIEHGGEIILDISTKSSQKVIKNKTGEIDSVDAPDALVNWHSHPINCYNNEKTVWGWPSGEDLRETLIYGLRGSACHIVPAVEGTYTMQPNPCIISGLLNIDSSVNQNDYPKLSSKINNWGDFLRGLIVATVEIYFRSSHVFRSTSYIKKHQDISAHDFVEFANIFKLENIFNKHNIKKCSKLGCNQIITYENERMSKMSFEKYVDEYESDTYIYLVNKNGDTSKSKIKYIDALKKGALELLKKLTIGSNCEIPVDKWNIQSVFQIRLYNNKLLVNDKFSVYDKLKFEDKLKFLKGPHSTNKKDIILDDKIIKFKLFDLDGTCNHNNLKNHMKIYDNSEVSKTEKVGSVKSVKSVKSVRRKNKKSRKSKGSVSSNKYGKRKSKGRKSVKRKSKGSKGYGKVSKKSKGYGDIMIIGSTECVHCTTLDKKTKERQKIYKFKYQFKEYPTIKEAINEAKKYDNKIDSIPAFFMNNKYLENPPF